MKVLITLNLDDDIFEAIEAIKILAKIQLDLLDGSIDTVKSYKESGGSGTIVITDVVQEEDIKD